jgi:hypothetical protein
VDKKVLFIFLKMMPNPSLARSLMNRIMRPPVSLQPFRLEIQ